jgi:hypothetical protein
MAKRIYLTGDKELFLLFEEMPRNLAELIIKGVSAKAGRAIVREAKKMTPDGPTGNLKRSIGVIRAKKGKPYVNIGARVKKKGRLESGFHAGWIAFGTANGVKGIGPWIQEAASRVENEVNQIVYRESGKIIDQRVRKYVKK